VYSVTGVCLLCVIYHHHYLTNVKMCNTNWAEMDSKVFSELHTGSSSSSSSSSSWPK